MTYAAAYAAWQADPQGWWAEAAEGIAWERRWDRMFDPALGTFGQWFAGARLNICANALDRHVEAGRGEQTALIWDSPMAGPHRAVQLPHVARPHRAGGGRARGTRRLSAATAW